MVNYDIDITATPAMCMPSARTSAFTWVPHGEVVVLTAAAKLRVQGTTVSADGTDVFVNKGAFPGTSAWSPPI